MRVLAVTAISVPLIGLCGLVELSSKTAAAKVLAAEPASWANAARVFRADLTPSKGADLMELLVASPSAPGAQVALALVAESVPDDLANSFLQEWLHERRPYGHEAALALSRLEPTPARAAFLDGIFADSELSWTTRAAALAGAIRTGGFASRIDAIRAAFLAGTAWIPPELATRFAIPSNMRQALERTMLRDALTEVVPRKLLPLIASVDPDAPWPALRQRVDRLVEALAGEPR